MHDRAGHKSKLAQRPRSRRQRSSAIPDPTAMYEQEALGAAARALPGVIASWMQIALEDRKYRIGPYAYETDLTVCPIVAAAKVAGIWHEGVLVEGHPAWGTCAG